MYMQYFYVYNQLKHKQYEIRWHNGQENLGNYTSKNHLARHHMQERHIYLHMNNSHRFLPRAMTPSYLRGCIGKSAGGYIQGRPLPLIPSFRS